MEISRAVLQRASEVGTDLRAVRPRLATSIRLYLPLKTTVLPIEHALLVRTDLRAVQLCRRGAFGEIALPRRCLGEVGFMVGPPGCGRMSL